MMTIILLALIGAAVTVLLIFILVKNWEWMPVILLPLVWFLPEQTSPGRLLENFIIARWLTIILVPVITVIQFIKISRSSRTFVPSEIFPPILIFTAFTLVSAIINGVSAFDFVAYVLIYIRYPLFFVVLTNVAISNDVVKSFLKLFLILIFLQVPETLIRHFMLGIQGDDISWSLGAWGTTNIGIYSIYAVCLIVARNISTKLKWWHFAAMLLLFLPAIYGEIKAFILWVPIVAIVVVIFATFKTRMTKYVTMISLIVIVGGASFFIAVNWQKIHKTNAIVGFLKNVSTVLDADMDQSSRYAINRLGTFMQIWNGLNREPLNAFFGFGPGASLVGNFSGRPGKITEFVVGVDTINQFGAALGDVGIIGTLLYYWLLLSLFRSVLRRNRSNDNNDLKFLRAAFVGIWFFYAFIGPAYHTVWRFDASSYILYFFAAILYGRAAVSSYAVEPVPANGLQRAR